jgi:nucleotide-binding universal stress UspA family protein
MYDAILFPTDGSEGAAVALDHVLDLAAAHGATVHVLNVADTTRDSVLRIGDDVVDVLEQEGDRVVDDVADRARRRGVEVVTEVRQGSPHSTIVDYAARHGVDLVVMPTHGRRGLERFLLGSTTERVVRRADVPVLTLQPDADAEVTHPYRNVLVATDGSDCARKALARGIDVARANGAALHLLSVVAVPALGADVHPEIQLTALEASAETIVEEATDVAKDADVDSVEGTVERGSSVPETIRSYVGEHGVDLVVVGTHGRTGFDRYLLGSVAEQLVRTSPVPVLTVRAPPPDAERRRDDEP